MKKTLMIIDDQKSTRLLLSHFLGRYFNVIEKSSALEALHSIEDSSIDAIIMDVLMPEMTGIDFLRTYQKAKPESMLPVLMLSSVENSSEKLKCFHYGARDYVVKPFNPEELLVRIKNLLPR
jgi:DNA-binding response OmpR family regulator